jgi:hypothetical protein
MKYLKNILSILLLTTIVACSNSTSNDLKRPSDIPEGVPPKWTHWHQEAYDDGRIGFNNDSSVMVVISPRPGLDLNNFKIDETLVK